ncbi:MAG: hypothetical protein LUG99_07710 [Lachnospiraceae bacterium]|nr:hypothetical protein [Lachnospiraceae bacterium]
MKRRFLAFFMAVIMAASTPVGMVSSYASDLSGESYVDDASGDASITESELESAVSVDDSSDLGSLIADVTESEIENESSVNHIFEKIPRGDDAHGKDF